MSLERKSESLYSTAHQRTKTKTQHANSLVPFPDGNIKTASACPRPRPGRQLARLRFTLEHRELLLLADQRSPGGAPGWMTEQSHVSKVKMHSRTGAWCRTEDQLADRRTPPGHTGKATKTQSQTKPRNTRTTESESAGCGCGGGGGVGGGGVQKCVWGCGSE